MNLAFPLFDRPLELPPQLQWKFGHEPELLGWTIRARNYNTTLANGIFIFMTTAAAGFIYILYSVQTSMTPFWKITQCALFMAIFLFALTGMTHQTMKFAYRFTKSGIEVCEWKDFPQGAITFMKWLTPMTLVIFLYLATIDPAFLLGALIGPGGTALTYWSMLNSKSYRDLHTEYHHLIYEWKDITQLAIATNREVVDFKFSHFNQRLGRVVTWNQNIFCQHKKKKQVAEFISTHIASDIPFIRARVAVPYGTD